MGKTKHSFRVSVDGRRAPEELLTSIESIGIERSISLPDQFTVQVSDPDLTVAGSLVFRLGSSLEVWLDETPGRSYKVMDGEVSGITLAAGDSSALTITGFDLSHRLTRGVVNERYVDMTDSEIIGQIARRHRLTARTARTEIRHPYLLQTNSDYDFLDTRADQLGFEWWVEDSELHFAPASERKTKRAEWGVDVSGLNVRASSATRVKEASVRVWDEDNQRTITTSEPVGVDADALGVNAPSVLGLFSGLPRDSSYQGETMTNTVVTADAAEAQVLVAGVAKQAESGQLSVSGQVDGMADLRPGMWLEIVESPGGLDGWYHVVQVSHSITNDSVTGSVQVGPAPETELADLMADSLDDAPERNWAQSGLVVGKVSDLSDPDGLGRVKVLFPTLGDGVESDWARVISAGGAEGRGFQVIPEVGDEVVVGFQSGDTRAAFVLGGVWSSTFQPPRATSDSVAEDVVVRRSWFSRLGHSIEFFDGSLAEDQGVMIELAGGDTSFWLGMDRVELRSSNEISVKTDGDLVLEAKGALSMKAKSVTVDGGDEFKVKATTVDVSGQSSTKLGASGASTEVGASGELKLSGGATASLVAPMVKLN